MPATVVDEVAAVDGVAEVTPILEATDTIAAGEERAVVYVVGLPADATMGGPWDVVEGSRRVGRGEVIVDQGFARRADVGIGDSVTILGGEARIVGLSEGTASLVNAVAFVSIDDFRAARGGAPVVSFVLVRTAPGADRDAVAAGDRAGRHRGHGPVARRLRRSGAPAGHGHERRCHLDHERHRVHRRRSWSWP